MKPEPLTKEKIKSGYDEITRKLLENLLHELDEEGRRFDLRTFEFEDVKSAVQWLLKEIELTDLQWIVYEDGKQERMSEKERKQILKNIIKKAFSGVVEG